MPGFASYPERTSPALADLLLLLNSDSPAETNKLTLEGLKDFLFDNGVPEIIAHGAGNWSHTGDTSETILRTVTLPALGANDSLSIEALYACSGTNTKTGRVRLGGIAGSILASTSVSTSLSWRPSILLANLGSVSSQIATPQTAGFGNSASGVVSTSVDTSTGTATIDFTGQLTNSAESIALRAYRIVRWRG